MFDLKKLRDTAIREGMKLLGNPRVMKLMADPRFMNLMMRAFQLRAQVQGALDAQKRRIARRFQLATRDEVETLRATLRSVEAHLQAMQGRGESDGHPPGPRA